MKEYFNNYRIDTEKLEKYGFNKENDTYKYETTILNEDMKVIITVLSDRTFDYKVIDNNINEPYDLIFVEDATGDYVGKARQEFENVIEDIKEKCSEKDIFKTPQSKQVIKYVKEKYNRELEYLWEKTPKAAIWRHSENSKWFGIIMSVSKTKIGLNDDIEIDVIDLKYPKEDLPNVVDNKNIFPGYHMNKKSWITIPLDNTMKIKEIYKYIDISYNCT